MPHETSDFISSETHGSPWIGSRPFFARTSGEIPDNRSNLVKQIQKLESEAEDLGRVRATLLVNFGSQRAHDGIVIKEHPNTVHMLFEVCEAYGRKIAASEAAKADLVDALRDAVRLIKHLGGDAGFQQTAIDKAK